MSNDFIDGGHVLLSRRLLDSAIFQNEKWFKVWVWCLLKANHKSKNVPVKTGKGTTVVKVERGQFVFGRKTAAKELNLKPTTVQFIISKLESMQNIVIHPITHCSIVTICNYDKYQDANNYNYQARCQATVRQPSTNRHKQECKECKEEKNIYTPNFENLWKAYPEKKGKKAAEKYFSASIKTEEEEKNIHTALQNYIKQTESKRQNGFPTLQWQNGSTWINNWKDYITIEEYQKPEAKELRGTQQDGLVTPRILKGGKLLKELKPVTKAEWEDMKELFKTNPEQFNDGQ